MYQPKGFCKDCIRYKGKDFYETDYCSLLFISVKKTNYCKCFVKRVEYKPIDK